MMRRHAGRIFILVFLLLQTAGTLWGIYALDLGVFESVAQAFGMIVFGLIAGVMIVIGVGFVFVFFGAIIMDIFGSLSRLKPNPPEGSFKVPSDKDKKTELY
ncbi:hypothetical protein [Parasulfitobacter algicola]|uniref:Uncharacterized protein n=1 Tax=Parasulfitobacter algicola TaxID=2614809 RepID=A0ABX2ISV2_9RHOB|nr:hypothetical protein [Sulfitobacter algicola]NSX53439.1 hypothetical protein [Sulfitobacter algicola]